MFIQGRFQYCLLWLDCEYTEGSPMLPHFDSCWFIVPFLMKLIRSRQASSDPDTRWAVCDWRVQAQLLYNSKICNRTAAAEMNNNLSTPQTLILLGSRTICNSVFNIASFALRGRFIIRNIKNVIRWSLSHNLTAERCPYYLTILLTVTFITPSPRKSYN
jgi:hypothetical protein